MTPEPFRPKIISRSGVFCQLCGQDIQGRGKSYRHPKWTSELNLLVCLDCDRNRARCQVCNMPMGTAPPNGICATCNQYSHLCQACGNPIKHSYIEFDGVGKYCQDCSRQRRPCDVCGAPLTDRQWELSDGRISCQYCNATAVYESQDAVALYEEMKAVAGELLGLKLNIPTGLALVDRNQLAEVIRQQSEKSPKGALQTELDAGKTLGLYARQGMRRGIYVQTGLPRMLFLQVAAHEYAHAWQGENCPLLRNLLVHEGFAEWIAYRILGYHKYTHAQARMELRQDIYGQGLRWALKIEAEHGTKGLLEACRQAK